MNFNIVPGQNRIVLEQRDRKVFWFPNDHDPTQKNLVIELPSEVGVVLNGGFSGLSIYPDFGKMVQKKTIDGQT